MIILNLIKIANGDNVSLTGLTKKLNNMKLNRLLRINLKAVELTPFAPSL